MNRSDLTRLPLWKRILFSILPAALLAVLLVAAELILRWVSPVPPARLAEEVQFDGITWYQTNRAFLGKYFPSGSPLIPEFKTALFRKEKTPSTFRVMCLGSSTMFGTPYDMNANIQGILRRQLRHRYPSLEWEVINWGASAINSNVVRDFAGDLLEFKPDLIIVYMGHNEYYGPDGVSASFLERLIPSLTPLKYSLQDLRLVQVVQGWFAGEKAKPEQAGNLMRQVSGGSLVRLGSDESRWVMGRFETNLDHILSTFAGAQVPVVLSEVSSNLAFPPFASDSVVAGRRQGKFDETMRALASENRFTEILNTVEGLKGSDAMHPLALYWKGVALRSTGQAQQAKAALRLARDHDLLKFRAPGEINSIIHAAAAKFRVPLVPADSLLSAASPDGIPDDSLFWEHLHPTPRGYYVIANGFLDAIAASDLVHAPVAVKDVLPFHMDSLHLCWLDLAYGDYSIQHLTGRWPFDRYARAPLVLQQADAQLLKLVQDTHARKIQWNDACYASATIFWRTGRLRDALTTYEAMLEEYPYSFYTNYLAGNLLSTMGEKHRAVDYLAASVRSNPEYLPPRLDLGLLEANSGRYEEALEQLQRVAGQSGTTQSVLRMKATALYGIGAVWANRGDAARAMEAVDQALVLFPGYPDALRLKEALERGR